MKTVITNQNGNNLYSIRPFNKTTKFIKTNLKPNHHQSVVNYLSARTNNEILKFYWGK